MVCSYCGREWPNNLPKCWDGVDGCGAFLGTLIEATQETVPLSFPTSVGFFTHYATVISMTTDAMLVDLPHKRKAQLIAREVKDPTKSFIRGCGCEEPLGLIYSPDAIMVTRNMHNTVALYDFVEMASQFISSDFGLWLINPSVYVALLSINSSQIFDTSKERDTMLGIPVVQTNGCASLGNKGDVILTDLRYYCVGEYGDMYDGVPLTGYDHGQQSPVVVLDDRITC